MKKLDKGLKITSFLVSFILVFVLFLSFFIKENLESFITYQIEVYGLVFIMLITGFLEIIPQFIAPHVILVNSQIIGFSIMYSILSVIIGVIIGALVGFYLGKKYGFRIVNDFYKKKKVNRLRKSIEKYGKWIIFIAALSPIPYIPIIFGSMGMKWRTFLIFGMVPRILGIVIVGFFFL